MLIGGSPELVALLRGTFQEEGYAVTHVQSVTLALDVLRASPACTVLFLGTFCGTSMVEAALHEPSMHQHTFVLVTRLARELPPAWCDLLDCLQVPIVPRPVERDQLLQELVA